MSKIKAPQEKMKEDEAKRATKHRVSSPKEATHTPRGKKIQSLEPRPILSLKPRPLLTLEPPPIQDVKRRPTSEDDSTLILLRESTPQEELVLPLTLLSHVPLIKPCIPPSTKQLQEEEDASVTLPTTSAPSATSTKLLLDTSKSTETQLVLP